jgi:hypothetical protein
MEHTKIGKFHINWADTGPFIIAIILIFYGYFGIISNLIMYNEVGHQLVYTSTEPFIINYPLSEVILFSFFAYPQTYYLPIVLLFVICFILSYLQEIPEAGIKTAIWFVPFIIITSFRWYSIINSPFTPVISLIGDGIRWNLLDLLKTRLFLGFEAFITFFSNWEGYVLILILSIANLSGAYGGIYLKRFVLERRKKMTIIDNIGNKSQEKLEEPLKKEMNS